MSVSDLRRSASPLVEVLMSPGIEHWEFSPEVERNPAKVSGAWVFRGTRVPVAALFENLRKGASIHEFLDWFPVVQRSQVESVLEYYLPTEGAKPI